MSSLARLFAAYRMELRLICLHWGYGLLHLIWTAFIIAYGNASQQQTAGSIMFGMSLALIPLLALVVMMLSTISASRAGRVRMEPLEAAYPTGGEVSIGRWLALITSASAFLIVPMGTALIVGPLDVFLRTLPVMLLESLIVIAVTSVGVWLVHVTIGIRRWMYPLFGLVWLGSGIIPQALDAEQIPIALLLAFSAQGWLNANVSELWGRLTLGNLPLFYDVFYLALIIFIIGIVLWQVHRRRFYHNLWSAALISGLAFVIMLVAGRAYSLEVAGAYAQVDEQTQLIFSNERSLILPDEVPYTFTDYVVNLNFVDTANPRFDVHIEAVNRGAEPLTELAFTLNHQLTITQADFEYVRDGFFVTVMLPQPLASGEAVSLSMQYEGALWYYDGSIRVGRPSLEVSAFTHPEGINLACPAAWYPVPGSIVVGRTRFFVFDNNMILAENSISRNYPDCILDEPASFTIHIEDAAGLRFASNLAQTDETTFAASSSTWAHVLAAPELVTEQISTDVTLITAEPLLEHSREVLNAHYLPALEHLRRFFPDIDGLSVIVTDSGFGDAFDSPTTPVTDRRLIAVLAPRFIPAVFQNPYNDYLFTEQAMVNSLFGMGERGFTPTYVADIGYFLWAHFAAGGDPTEMQVILTDGIPQTGIGRQVYSSQTTAERYPLAQFFYRVYVEQGEAAVIDLLNRILDHTSELNTLPYVEVQAWIEESARGN